SKEGRMPFPTTIPMEGKPLTMALGKWKPDGQPSLAVITDVDGKRSLLTRNGDGKIHSQKLGESFKSNPSSLMFHDDAQDGLSDLVVLIPYEKIKILRQVPGRDFEEIGVAPPGGTSEQPWVSVADVDNDGRDELLLAQKNFLRAIILKGESDTNDGTNKVWSFIVKDQVNGAASNSRIGGAAPVRNGSNAVPSLFLLDAERKALTLSERDTNGVWQVIRNIPLAFTEFTELRPLGLAARRPNSVAFPIDRWHDL